jgi:hypothetical protein
MHLAWLRNRRGRYVGHWDRLPHREAHHHDHHPHREPVPRRPSPGRALSRSASGTTPFNADRPSRYWVGHGNNNAEISLGNLVCYLISTGNQQSGIADTLSSGGTTPAQSAQIVTIAVKDLCPHRRRVSFVKDGK